MEHFVLTSVEWAPCPHPTGVRMLGSTQGWPGSICLSKIIVNLPMCIVVRQPLPITVDPRATQCHGDGKAPGKNQFEACKPANGKQCVSMNPTLDAFCHDEAQLSLQSIALARLQEVTSLAELSIL